MSQTPWLSRLCGSSLGGSPTEVAICRVPPLWTFAAALGFGAATVAVALVPERPDAALAAARVATLPVPALLLLLLLHEITDSAAPPAANVPAVPRKRRRFND